MADNVAVTEGSGKTVATEDTGGFQVQRVKPTLGAAGTAVNLSSGAGNTDTGTQRVVIATNQAAVPVSGPLTDTQLRATAVPVSGTVTATGPLTDTQLRATAVPISLAAAAAAIAKAEDVASADADVGVPAMAVRKATPANTSGTDGDYEMLQMSAGRLWASAVVEASENVLGKTVGIIINPTANFTRPADTTAYAVGDLVANNTTAGSVTPLSWSAARVATGNLYIRRARLRKSTTGLTNAAFRLHIYASAPTVSNGDNGVWSSPVADYMGAIDITVAKAFSDGAQDHGVPNTGGEINIALASGQTIYGLLEARGAYAPGNAEVFTVALEIWQN